MDMMTPNGDLLIEHLSFTVRSVKNVIVVGPNGCGKSSLFRTIGEEHYAIKDDQLRGLRDEVQLTYLIQCEGGFDGVQDWMDVLSGGEKQRIAMARLVYHKTQFAILDECTSAVSVDVEGFIYEYCRTVGLLFSTYHIERVCGSIMNIASTWMVQAIKLINRSMSIRRNLALA